MPCLKGLYCQNYVDTDLLDIIFRSHRKSKAFCNYRWLVSSNTIVMDNLVSPIHITCMLSKPTQRTCKLCTQRTQTTTSGIQTKDLVAVLDHHVTPVQPGLNSLWVSFYRIPNFLCNLRILLYFIVFWQFAFVYCFAVISAINILISFFTRLRVAVAK